MHDLPGEHICFCRQRGVHVVRIRCNQSGRCHKRVAVQRVPSRGVLQQHHGRFVLQLSRSHVFKRQQQHGMHCVWTWLFQHARSSALCSLPSRQVRQQQRYQRAHLHCVPGGFVSNTAAAVRVQQLHNLRRSWRRPHRLRRGLGRILSPDACADACERRKFVLCWNHMRKFQPRPVRVPHGVCRRTVFLYALHERRRSVDLPSWI